MLGKGICGVTRTSVVRSNKVQCAEVRGSVWSLEQV